MLLSTPPPVGVQSILPGQVNTPRDSQLWVVVVLNDKDTETEPNGEIVRPLKRIIQLGTYCGQSKQ